MQWSILVAAGEDPEGLGGENAVHLDGRGDDGVTNIEATCE
jgi:hypothetical protein